MTDAGANAAALSHLFVHVGDVGVMRRFYGELFGLPIADLPGGYVRIGCADGFHLGVEEVAGLAHPDETELVVRVPDVDAVHATLRANGTVVDAPPQDMPWGLRQMWLRDPNGLRLSVYTPNR